MSLTHGSHPTEKQSKRRCHGSLPRRGEGLHSGARLQPSRALGGRSPSVLERLCDELGYASWPPAERAQINPNVRRPSGAAPILSSFPSLRSQRKQLLHHWIQCQSGTSPQGRTLCLTEKWRRRNVQVAGKTTMQQ